MSMQYPRVPYALTVFDDAERNAVQDAMQTPMIVPGEKVRAFESNIAELFGKRHGIMTNSGSSANLVAFELMELPKGSEVITPAVTFNTTVAPIVQKGLVPVFTDVVEGEYNIDINQIEELITPKTKALMVPSLIGNIPNMEALQQLAKQYKLWFIEDSCDTLGATFNGKPTGYFSHISTTSFYASHIITTAGAGGMLCVSHPELEKHARVFTGWGRSSAVNESEDPAIRFGAEVDGIPYDAKFIFNHIGYNFQSTELNAAFGLAQLDKFEQFFEARLRNFKKLYTFFSQYEQFFILPKQLPQAKTAWLAFPLTIRKDAPFTRIELATFLENRNIQTRPLFSGNVLRQPAYKQSVKRTRAHGYPVADHIMSGALLLGCHQGLTQEMIDHLCESFDTFLHKR